MPDGFALWPVADIEPFGHLPLDGELSHAEVGTAVMCIAGCNDMEPGQGDDRPLTAANLIDPADLGRDDNEERTVEVIADFFSLPEFEMP